MSAWGFTSAFLFLLWAGTVLAVEPPDRSATPPGDIIITSQSLVFRNQDNTAFFEGKVVMTKGVFVMHADQMTIYFDGAASSNTNTAAKGTAKSAPSPRPAAPDLPTFGSRGVSHIDASGNVVMQQGAKRAKSKKALYYQRDEKLVLTGDPEVWEEGYRVTGTKMTMLLKEDRSIVEGSRVIINDAGQAPR
jgi:lipopolysaccharide export system protein LptA